MVVSKSDLKKPTNKDKRAIKRDEEILDEGLRSGGRTFNITLFSSKGYAYQELLSKYEKSGWKVKYVSDQRDGDYLEFS